MANSVAERGKWQGKNRYGAVANTLDSLMYLRKFGSHHCRLFCFLSAKLAFVKGHYDKSAEQRYRSCLWSKQTLQNARHMLHKKVIKQLARSSNIAVIWTKSKFSSPPVRYRHILKYSWYQELALLSSHLISVGGLTVVI